MILSDTAIRDFGVSGGIEGFIEKNVQPASYDITLSDQFVEYNNDSIIDVNDKSSFTVDTVSVDEDGSIIIPPNGFVIGSSQEVFHFDASTAGSIEGRSSVGRAGIQVHPVAGWIDPGFNGTLTLPLKNMGRHPVRLTAGMRIAQVVFYGLDNPAHVTYDLKQDSRYNGQNGPTASRIAEGENE